MLTVSRVWDWGQHHQENKKLQADLTQREFAIRELTKTVEHLQARGCVILPACFPLHTADVFLFHTLTLFYTPSICCCPVSAIIVARAPC